VFIHRLPPSAPWIGSGLCSAPSITALLSVGPALAATVTNGTQRFDVTNQIHGASGQKNFGWGITGHGTNGK
jgi:hypothetical protein